MTLTASAGRLRAPAYSLAPDTPAEIANDLARLVAERTVPTEPTTAAEARACHLRRQLEAAAEHGAAMLDALGLPQLAALDNAIATLDELDGDPDLESEPGYDAPEGDDERCASDQVEDEDSLGWGAGVSQLHLHVEGWPYGECEETAPERHDRGFVRSGPDDSEDEDPAEFDFRSRVTPLSGARMATV